MTIIILPTAQFVTLNFIFEQLIERTVQVKTNNNVAKKRGRSEQSEFNLTQLSLPTRLQI